MNKITKSSGLTFNVLTIGKEVSNYALRQKRKTIVTSNSKVAITSSLETLLLLIVNAGKKEASQDKTGLTCITYKNILNGVSHSSKLSRYLVNADTGKHYDPEIVYINSLKVGDKEKRVVEYIRKLCCARFGRSFYIPHESLNFIAYLLVFFLNDICRICKYLLKINNRTTISVKYIYACLNILLRSEKVANIIIKEAMVSVNAVRNIKMDITEKKVHKKKSRSIRKKTKHYKH